LKGGTEKDIMLFVEEIFPGNHVAVDSTISLPHALKNNEQIAS
jgi:hypothetical protein